MGESLKKRTSEMRVDKAKLDKAIFMSDYNIMTICKKAKVSSQMLNYYRRGLYYPNVLIAVRLAEILNFRVEDIWNDHVGRTATKEIQGM